MENKIKQTINIGDIITDILIINGSKNIRVGKVVGFTNKKVKVEFPTYYGVVTLPPDNLSVIDSTFDLESYTRRELGYE